MSSKACYNYYFFKSQKLKYCPLVKKGSTLVAAHVKSGGREGGGGGGGGHFMALTA